MSESLTEQILKHPLCNLGLCPRVIVPMDAHAETRQVVAEVELERESVAEETDDGLRRAVIEAAPSKNSL